MLKQKEYKLLMKQFEQNNMEGYEVWFNKNVNCEIKDITKWRRAIRLHSTSKKYAVIAVKSGFVYRVVQNSFRMI